MNRDLGRSADAERNADGADSAVHIELAARLHEVPRDVWSYQAAGCELRADEFKRGLAPVSVSRKAEIDSEFRGTVEGIGIMAEQNVDVVRLDQPIHPGLEPAGEDFASVAEGAFAGEIDADEVEGIGAARN